VYRHVQDPGTSAGTYEIGYFTFYGIGGERLGEYKVMWTRQGFSPYFTYLVWFEEASTSVSFGGRLLKEGDWSVIQDRLGSVRWRKRNSDGLAPAERLDYYPYGIEKPPPGGGVTADGATKFATYFRDGGGLDYADQRYYQSGWGRFLTPDPYQASGGVGDPGSWNRYAYTRGDPVNRYDPRYLRLRRHLTDPSWKFPAMWISSVGTRV
jgi:RHS repeat-associated protein